MLPRIGDDNKRDPKEASKAAVFPMDEENDDDPVSGFQSRAGKDKVSEMNEKKRKLQPNDDDHNKVFKRPRKASKLADVATNEKDKDDGLLKKPISRRVWSDGDEITILNGIVEFREKSFSSPLEDMTAFHRFICKSIPFECSQTQLSDKIRKLKWRYKKMTLKNKGECPIFHSIHQKNVYLLSKTIWAADDKDRNGEPVKTTCNQRAWSNEDEIVLLEGIVEYMNKGSNLPWGDMHSFHNFLKQSIYFNFSYKQLLDKIYRLKYKYMKTIANEGENPVVTEPQEEKAYRLSRYIWGNEINKSMKQHQVRWSKNDEIVMLTGIIEYLNKGFNLSPANMHKLHHFLQESFSFKFSPSQLTDKIHRLKWKYKRMRIANDGKDPDFCKLHERKAYNLWKKIWGSSKDDSEPSDESDAGSNFDRSHEVGRFD